MIATSPGELPNNIHDLPLMFRGQTVVERQAKDPIANVLSHWAVADFASEPPSHLGEVERQVVEDAKDASLLQGGDKCLPDA